MFKKTLAIVDDTGRIGQSNLKALKKEMNAPSQVMI